MNLLHHLAVTLLTLSGILTDNKEWHVQYPDPVCVLSGSSVTFSCNYSYPSHVGEVVDVSWCLTNNSDEMCKKPPYIYNSAMNQTSEGFKYIGDKKSKCTLLISNVQFRYSGLYRFRFTANGSDDKWTGMPGVILEVAEVSVTKFPGNGTLKEGDSLNLTCNVNCTHPVTQFIWSKNNKSLPESGPVLHFPALTACDSGSYTCTLHNSKASETISIHVEGICCPSWVTALVIGGVILVVLAMAVLALNYSMRGNAEESTMRH